MSRQQLQKFVHEKDCLNAVGLDATRSFTLGVEGYSQLTLEIELNRDAGVTQIDVTYHTKRAGESNWKKLTCVSAAAAGVQTRSTLTDRFASISADDNWTINMPINYDLIKVTFTSTAGTATDLLTVRATLGSA